MRFASTLVALFGLFKAAECATQVAPTDILFLLDASASIDKERFYGDVLNFTSRFIPFMPESSKVGVITFNREIKEIIPFSTYTPAAWDAEVERVRTERSSCCICCSPFAEAFELATQILSDQSQNQKRAVLLFTDGNPYQNSRSPEFPSKYAWEGSKENEQDYMIEVVPQTANALKEMGARLVVVAHPGIIVKDGSPTLPNSNYFSGQDTVLGAEGNEKVCVDLQRFKPEKFCKRTTDFPIVSNPYQDNLISIPDWTVFGNITDTLMCNVLGRCELQVQITGDDQSPSGAPTVGTVVNDTTESNVTLPGNETETDSGNQDNSTVVDDTRNQTATEPPATNSSDRGLPCSNGECTRGMDCVENGDCAAGLFCLENGLLNTCTTILCQDEVKSGNETDVDCGGTECLECTLGQSCLTDSDCAGSLCCNDYNLCEGPESVLTKSWFGAVVTAFVLAAYALTGVISGRVTFGDGAALNSQKRYLKSFTQVASVFTFYEYIAYAQFATIGATLNLPSVPNNYLAFSSAMGYTLFNFVQVGPNPSEESTAEMIASAEVNEQLDQIDELSGQQAIQLHLGGTYQGSEISNVSDFEKASDDYFVGSAGGYRLLSDVDLSNFDAMERYARQWNLRPDHFIQSVFIGFTLTVLVVAVVCFMAKIFERYRKGGNQVLFSFYKVLWVVWHAIWHVAYYGTFPLSLACSYQFFLSLQDDYESLDEDVVFTSTVGAGIWLGISIIFVGFAVSATKKMQPCSLGWEDANPNAPDERDAMTSRTSEQSSCLDKDIYQTLTADFRYECRYFWLARIGLGVLRGIIVGSFVTGETRPIQPVAFLMLTIVHAVMIFKIKPYKTSTQNTSAIIVVLLYIPSILILFPFDMYPAPFAQIESYPLGAFAIVVHVLIMLLVAVFLAYNFVLTIWTELRKPKEEPRSEQNEANESNGTKRADAKDGYTGPIPLHDPAQQEEYTEVELKEDAMTYA